MPSTNFLASLDELAPRVTGASRSLKDDLLVWISQNRDFGEDERYRAKDDVDTSLTSSDVISAERRAIEAIFARGDPPAEEVELYSERLHQELAHLHSNVVSLAMECPGSLAEQVMLWARHAKQADVDNAHAMYLSSGNWDFSVFNNIIDALMTWAGDDPDVMSDILTGGTSDVRTAVYELFGATYEGLDRREFIAAVRANDDWTRPGGYVTIMCFGAATGGRGRPVGIASSAELAERFETAVDRLAANFPDAPVAETATVYHRLFDLRRRYDIYEYFGAYAFYRNLAIHRLGTAVEATAPELADELRYLATTYQFGPLVRGLRSVNA